VDVQCVGIAHQHPVRLVVDRFGPGARRVTLIDRLRRASRLAQPSDLASPARRAPGPARDEQQAELGEQQRDGAGREDPDGSRRELLPAEQVHHDIRRRSRCHQEHDEGGRGEQQDEP
jgi:hypothetical protein